MYRILPCPSCQQTLLLNDATSTSESLRCPNCDFETSLEQLAEQLPSWVVSSSAETPPAVAKQAEVTSAGEPPHSNLAAISNVAQTADAPPSEQDSASEQPNQSEWTDFKPISREQHRRNKKKSRSPIWSILQVVLGGAASVPIALLLLWYVFGKDVGDAGRTVSKYVPWIVPKQFHAPEVNPTSNTTPRPQRPNATGNSRGGFRDFGFGDKADGDLASSLEPAPAFPLDSPTEIGSPATEPAPTAPEPAPPSTTETGETEDINTAAVLPSDAIPDAANNPAEEAVNGVADDIFSVARVCNDKLTIWQTAVAEKDPSLRMLAREVYQSLTDLAAALEQEPSPNPRERVVQEALVPIGEKLLQEDVQMLIRQGSRFWLELHAADASLPLAIMTPVKDVSLQDGSYQIASSQPGIGAFQIPEKLLQGEPKEPLIMLGIATKAENPSGDAPTSYSFNALYVAEQ